MLFPLAHCHLNTPSHTQPGESELAHYVGIRCIGDRDGMPDWCYRTISIEETCAAEINKCIKLAQEIKDVIIKPIVTGIIWLTLVPHVEELKL
jgi:hypothetical protein